MPSQLERRTKTRYTTEEATNYIIFGGEDSELSDLSDSDHENEEIGTNEVDNEQNVTEEDIDSNITEEDIDTNVTEEDTDGNAIDVEVTTRRGAEAVSGPSSANSCTTKTTLTQQSSSTPVSMSTNDENSDTSSDVNSNIDLEDHDDTISASMKNHKYRWRKIAPPQRDGKFTGKAFSLPPDDFDVLQPYDFFNKIWSRDITELLVEQTNLYSVQTTGKSVNTNFSEVEQILGIQMMMGIIKMPTYHYYWANETRYPLIADTMSHNRYKTLRRMTHVVDNTLRDEKTPDKLFKIRPILEKVRENCIKIEQEPVMSIDEQIIPAKTRRSGIRQYNPKKPVKWGFKMLVRAGISGMIYDFFLYTGKNSIGKENCSCEGTVLRLVKHLPKGQKFKLCFDNWFSTLALMLKMKELGILTSATLRANRSSKCPLDSDITLKKKGRRSSSHMVDANSAIIVMKWMDNRAVHLVSNYGTVAASTQVKRWDGTKKKHVMVDCPDIVKEYNAAMGGVDLADMLISLYRTPWKSKKWYLRVLVHCLDIAKVNAWLLYRRYADQLNIPKGRQMRLCKFSSQIAHALLQRNKPVDRPVGRPLKRKSLDERTEPEADGHQLLNAIFVLTKSDTGRKESNKKENAAIVK
jgi:hypothetical protein